MELHQQQLSTINSAKNNTNGNNDNNNKIYPEVHAENPRALIPELCKQFYSLGWVSGTGGGLSIRQNGIIYCAPSGVQKERIKPEDLFELDYDGKIVVRPENDKLKCSECLSLFMCTYKLRDAGCCIHVHSIYANLVTLMCSQPKTTTNNNNNAAINEQSITNGTAIKEKIYEFRISHQEMIKGIAKGSSNNYFNYTDTLVVPIINNVLYERDLAGAMGEAIKRYPHTNAVLVKDHGCYVWGKTWDKAKSMAECYDYLFRLKFEAAKVGIQLCE